jgi:hypothetical protein
MMSGGIGAAGAPKIGAENPIIGDTTITISAISTGARNKLIACSAVPFFIHILQAILFCLSERHVTLPAPKMPLSYTSAGPPGSLYACLIELIS